MRQLKTTAPTPEIVAGMLPSGTAGDALASVWTEQVVKIPLSTTGGTANADLVSWVNPENGTITVTRASVYLSTTGTGTFDMGVSDDGTGASDNMINGGTMNTAITQPLIAYSVNTAGTAGTIGVVNGWNLGPGGSGTNNSIVAKTTETATTAVGALFLTYHRVG
jgi:hypothetical protein